MVEARWAARTKGKRRCEVSRGEWRQNVAASGRENDGGDGDGQRVEQRQSSPFIDEIACPRNDRMPALALLERVGSEGIDVAMEIAHAFINVELG